MKECMFKLKTVWELLFLEQTQNIFMGMCETLVSLLPVI